MQICPGCGEENPDKFRLCGICGTPLHPHEPPPEVRKTVTIVFSDLKGSTDLGERLDSEALRAVLTRYFDEMKTVLERHGGTVEKFIGDAVMAVFGLPRLHEDDALRAVRAAFEMKDALATLNNELRERWGVTLVNRTGVNTGEVVAGDPVGGQRLVTGDTVNVAARLEQVCPELEILLGEPTYRLVRDAVDVEQVEPLELKGKSERVPAYLLRAVRGGEMLNRRPDAPFVGREHELEVLRGALETVTRGRTSGLVAVLAQAGVGKSRLLAQFVREVQPVASVFDGRCLSYGDGTFWPLAEVVRQAAGIGGDDTPEGALGGLVDLADGDEGVAVRVASLIGLGSEPFPIEESLWGVRRLLEILAADRPIVIRLEDLHWAEPGLLDLLEHVLDSVRAPVLLLCSSRPELLEVRPDWEERFGVTVLRLEKLSAADTERIADELLDGEMDERVRARVSAAAEGNPLFVEQMVSMLVEDGVLRREGDRWVAAGDLAEIETPPSISALLSSRLDRLSIPERATVEPASVIGQVFYRGAVAALTLGPPPVDVDASLDALERKQFVEPSDERFSGEDAFRFHHILVRDAAYQGVLKLRRAELHEGFADWMDLVAGPRGDEYEEIVAYHLDRAWEYRRQLGPLDEHGLAVGARAAERSVSAGRRAARRGDAAAAARLLARATEHLPAGEPRRPRLLVELAEVLLEEGRFDEAEKAIGEAIDDARTAGDTLIETTAEMTRIAVRFATDPEELGDRVLGEAERAIAIFEQAGDDAGLARVWRLLGQVHGTAASYAEAEFAIERTIHFAQLAGDAQLVMRNHAPYAIAALSGPRAVPVAITRCEELLRETHGDRRTEGVVLCALAQLRAMQGDFEQARSLYARARSLLDDLGVRVLAASVSLDSGPVEMLAGDFAAAERELRRDHDVLTSLGEKYLLSTLTAYLALAVGSQDRPDEAMELADEAEDLAVEDDVETLAIIRQVRARVLAARGEHEEAERLARESVSLVEQTDSPDMQGDAYAALGAVLSAAGRAESAGDAYREALARFEAKENLVAAAATRAEVERLEGSYTRPR